MDDGLGKRPVSAASLLRSALVQRSVLVGVGAGCVFFVGRALVRSWDEASEALRSAEPAPIVAAFVAAILAMVVIAVLWDQVLRHMAQDPPLIDSVRWYFVGELGKYIPGGIWPLVGRAELARRNGIDATPAYLSTVLSLGYLVASCMFFGSVASLAAGEALWIALVLGAGAATLVVLLSPMARTRIADRSAQVRNRTAATTFPSGRATVVFVAAYGLSWLGIVASTGLVAIGVGDDVDQLQLASATLTAWVAGFVVVPVPGGLGVREAVFIALADLPEGQAVTIAIMARALLVAVDVGGAALSAVSAPPLRAAMAEARR